jgi:curved DNA-binding protein CbpA
VGTKARAVSNLYAVLNVPADADRTTVRASFRTLALRFHPDHGGDAQRMEAVIDAWAILGHPERRAAYDLTLAVQRGTLRRRKTDRPLPTPVVAEAPGPDTLSYGRYTGWTIEALAEHDPDYLEWLGRSPGGRVWQTRIDAALTARMVVPAPTPQRPKRFW